MTAAEARRIALSFPCAEEAAHHGHPDFRVRNKIFASLRPEQGTVAVKLSPAEQADLVAAAPRAFSRNAWSRQGWTTVHLAAISPAEFRAVVASSWRRVAPPRLGDPSEPTA